MARRQPTIPEKLESFISQWCKYQGHERSGAQPFLYELLNIYDVWLPPGQLFEQHTIRVRRPKKKDTSQNYLIPECEISEFVETPESMDMYIPKICVWEMKSPSEKDLQKHHDQVLGYWAKMRPRYMVLCNFHEFWIYDTDEENGQNVPKSKISLSELAEHWEALLFLRGEESHFPKRSVRVTREMAEEVGGLVRRLIDEADDPERDRDRVTKFALEAVFAMFAEDAELIPPGMFSRALEDSVNLNKLDPVYTLFDDFAQENDYERSNPNAPYVNGSLYDHKHPKIPLTLEQIQSLWRAAKGFDWRDVRPEIFGSIFEQALDPSERHELGAHFTSEKDIMRVVRPTIVEPWRERLRAIKSEKDAAAAIEQMKNFHILDPACGCGNFLYIAYREMKLLEAGLKKKWNERQKSFKIRPKNRKPPPPGPYFTLYQLHGIEINSFAAQLSKAVLWIGEFLADRELGLDERTLPLKNLDNVIVHEDALFIDWPRPEGELAIIGNPPYLGVRKMRTELSHEYVERLFEAFPENRAADYVTYWFPKALGVLRKGERAGFVTTNSIAQNESRQASIDKVLDKGGTLLNVWKSYPWSGEAAVHVSIVNWIQDVYEGVRYLDGEEAWGITPSLTDDVDVSQAQSLEKNKGISFMGVTPGNKEFVLSDEEREAIIADDPKSAEVIRPFLIGRDLNREPDQRPTRWIIDFGTMTQKEAKEYKAAFRQVQRYVYPIRKENRREAYAKRWWRFVEARPGLRAELSDKKMFLGVPALTKHLQFTRVETSVLPDHQVIVISLDDWYHLGILQSAVHEIWVWNRASTLETRLRYTATTVFESFPFPPHNGDSYDPRIIPKIGHAKRVQKFAEEYYTLRSDICSERQIGLTKVYNLLREDELPELLEKEERLNGAVCDCYGWPSDTWRDKKEVLTRLLELNFKVAGK